MPSISGQSILVIGGTSGIGFAVAKLALEAGARVTVASSNATRVTNAISTLKSFFPEAQISGFECDITLEDAESCLEKLFEASTAKGTDLLNHIVSTAGRAPDTKALQDTDVSAAVKIQGVGFVSALAIAKLAPNYLKKDYSSSLNFTGGQVAEKPIPGYTISSAFAAGLVGMVRNLALDIAPLRVNLVNPGPTITEMWGPSREQIAEVMAKKALLGKAASPEEVAEAYIYLMKNSDATGSVVSSNGGSVLR